MGPKHTHTQTSTEYKIVALECKTGTYNEIIFYKYTKYCNSDKSNSDRNTSVQPIVIYSLGLIHKNTVSRLHISC